MVSLPLSYVPIHESLHVYLNGVEQYEPLDWTYNTTTNSIDSSAPMEPVSGDLLECRYAHQSESRTVPVGAFVAATSGLTGASTPIITLPTNVAGDQLILGIVTQGYGPSTSPAGWTYEGLRHVANDVGDTVTLLVYHKVSSGSEPASITGFSSGSGNTAWVLASYRGVLWATFAWNDSNTPTNTPDSTSYSQTAADEGRNVFLWSRRPANGVSITDSTERADQDAITNIGVAISDAEGPVTTTATKVGASAWGGAVVNLQ
jgi:hypothetical protein